MKKYYLAVDIGASSGRHIVGCYENGELVLDEVFRFKNGVSESDGHLIWDIDYLFDCVKEGIRKAFEKYSSITSLSIDTWGVDYVLMKGDERIMPCYTYRDSRTKESIPEVHKIIPFEELYEKTGIQFQSFNTIYQLYSDKMCGRLDEATDFLMIPAYLGYMLTGVKHHEYTNASTTGILNAAAKDFDGEIIERLGLPKRLFGTPLMPGAFVGRLKPEIAEYVGGQLNVLACASHDTASAVDAIPMEGDNPYISSGTWSLLGAKISAPNTGKESFGSSYSNEGGVSYICYLKNIMGMWIINNLKSELAPDKTFDEAMEMAMESDFEGIVDVTDERFLAPASMKDAFVSYFAPDKAPKSAGDFFKSAHLSLADSYRVALGELSALTGKKYERLYIVGGGAKNKYLNELAEKACGIKVVALPIEATAIGNIKVQAEADNA